MNNKNTAKGDLAIGARQLVIDNVLRVLIEHSRIQSPVLGSEIVRAVNSYCSTLDLQSEVEVEFIGTANAYLASLLPKASDS